MDWAVLKSERVDSSEICIANNISMVFVEKFGEAVYASKSPYSLSVSPGLVVAAESNTKLKISKRYFVIFITFNVWIVIFDFHIIAADTNAIPALLTFAISPSKSSSLAIQLTNRIHGTKTILLGSDNLISAIAIREVSIALSRHSSNAMTSRGAKFLANLALGGHELLDVLGDLPVMPFLLELVYLSADDLTNVQVSKPGLNLMEKVEILL